MQDILRNNLSDTMELDALPEAVREGFLEEVGAVVLDSALIRATVEMSEEQSTALAYYLKSGPTAEEMFTYLVQRCKGFSDIFEEEVLAFREEASSALTAIA